MLCDSCAHQIYKVKEDGMIGLTITVPKRLQIVTNTSRVLQESIVTYRSLFPACSSYVRWDVHDDSFVKLCYVGLYPVNKVATCLRDIIGRMCCIEWEVHFTVIGMAALFWGDRSSRDFRALV